MLGFWQASLLLLFSSVPALHALENGDVVCAQGYIMDNYCIFDTGGVLLDNQRVVTLQQPELHSVHCLVDVGVCRNSGFVVLNDKEAGSNVHTLGYEVDSAGTQTLINTARSVGICTTCQGGGSVRFGFRAGVVGTVLNANADPPLISVDRAEPIQVGMDFCRSAQLPPTMFPTIFPTNEPTELPSRSPTPPPTVSPTLPPTVSPTGEPTATPTSQPTMGSTPEPTASPTTPPPTVSPTRPPTLSPTTAPSLSPIAVPIELPVAAAVPPEPAPVPTVTLAEPVNEFVSTLPPSDQPSQTPSMYDFNMTANHTDGNLTHVECENATLMYMNHTDGNFTDGNYTTMCENSTDFLGNSTDSNLTSNDSISTSESVPTKGPSVRRSLSRRRGLFM